MGGISIGGIYAVAIRFFRQHRVQRYRMGSRHRSIHLAGTPPSFARRSVAASAHLAQLPLHRASISGARGRIAGHALCLGDIIAAVLALLALTSLPSAAGIVIAWIFNLSGAADLFNAFYQANHAGLTAGQLGSTYFIPTLIVPLLLITHGLGFRILLRRENESVMHEGRQAA
jgi:hypothetical protein